MDVNTIFSCFCLLYFFCFSFIAVCAVFLATNCENQRTMWQDPDLSHETAFVLHQRVGLRSPGGHRILKCS